MVGIFFNQPYNIFGLLLGTDEKTASKRVVSNTYIMHAGFVQEENQERMLAVDLPTFNPEISFETKEDDTYFYGPSGLYNNETEIARLQALLEEMPTTPEDDKRLLESGNIMDWKMATVIQLRMGRKIALKKAIESIREVLDDSSKYNNSREEL